MSIDPAPFPLTRLGLLVSGSVAEGLAARLDPLVPIEDVRLGKFVKIAGHKYEYFCLVTDVQLESANGDVLRDPPGDPTSIDQFLRQVLAGTTTYALIKLKPELMLANPLAAAMAVFEPADQVPRPARTIPPHFSIVSEATRADFERVFGAEDGSNTHFQIGQPIDMDVPVCLDLRRLVERSNGIFGKSGTGKSFLTRMLLCGLIRTNSAVNLIFDMHSEYGWSAKNEDGVEVKGLSQLFGSRVAVYTLDMESARGRGVRPAGEIKIALRELSVADIPCFRTSSNYIGRRSNRRPCARTSWAMTGRHGSSKCPDQTCRRSPATRAATCRRSTRCAASCGWSRGCRSSSRRCLARRWTSWFDDSKKASTLSWSLAGSDTYSLTSWQQT